MYTRVKQSVQALSHPTDGRGIKENNVILLRIRYYGYLEETFYMLNGGHNTYGYGIHAAILQG